MLNVLKNGRFFVEIIIILFHYEQTIFFIKHYNSRLPSNNFTFERRRVQLFCWVSIQYVTYFRCRLTSIFNECWSRNLARLSTSLISKGLIIIPITKTHHRPPASAHQAYLRAERTKGMEGKYKLNMVLCLTFLGLIAAPKSGKTVAPPASTSLICGGNFKYNTFR